MKSPPGISFAAHYLRGHVAVVDNDSVFQSFMAIALGLEGYDAVSLRSAAAALTYLRVHHPVFAVVDYILPDLDGLTLVERLRADIATRDLPILMCTAAQFVDAPVLAVRIARARVRLLRKPFGLDEMSNAIRELLAQPRQ